VASNDGVDDESKGECGNWDYSDSKRCHTPEFLLCVSGENKVPPRTVNATEDGAEGNQEQDVVPLAMSVDWNVERRDVHVGSGEGICSSQQVIKSGIGGERKRNERRKEK